MSVRLNGGVIELDLSTFGINPLTNGMTVGMWIKKVGNFADYDPPLSFGASTNDRGNSIELQFSGGGTSSAINCALNGSGPTSSDVWPPTGVVMNVGTWYYVAFTRPATTGGASSNNLFYAGSIGALTQSTTLAHTASGSYRYLRIGDLKQSGVVSKFNGEVAHIRIWNTQLTLSQLNTESASLTPVVTNGLVYGCQLSSASSKTDLSGNSLVWSSVGTVTDGSSTPIVPIMPPVIQVADGYTPSGSSSTVDTGVGGQDFSKNVTAGNTLDVIFMAHASSGHSCVISKASGTATIGTPIQIDHIDDTAPTNNQYTEIYRFLVPITGSGSLRIRATYGKTNEDIMIAAAEISGGTINGYVVNNNVGSPDVGGELRSGLITPNTNSGILCGWAAMANPGPPAKTSPTAGGGSTLAVSSLFTGFNSGLSYETQVLSSSTQIETVFTSAQAYERTYVLGAFFSSQVVSSISNVNNTNIITSTQIGVAVNGVALSTGTVDIVQGLAVVPQTVTSVTASKITFDVVFDTGSQFDLYYGAATLRVTIGNSIINQGIIIAPPSNKSYFNIGTVNPVSSIRLTTSPDLQAGDQIEISSVGGTGVTLSDVNINTDGSFDVSSGVTQFSYRVWSIADLVWGSYAVETVSSNSRRRILIIG